MTWAIQPPDLDLRDEERLAAEAIAFVTGGLTSERIDYHVNTLLALKSILANGGLPPAICPELTNANPSAPHTVLLEAQAWLLAQIARRINQLPVRDQIEFARLFGIERYAAAYATTTLEFTVAAPPPTVNVTIPVGTQVATEDGMIVFETLAELVVPVAQGAGTIAARRMITGATVLASHTLTRLDNALAYVTSVVNPLPIDSGSDVESVESALARARGYQRRAERLVSAQDVEDAIREEVLQGQGIVRVFELISNANWTEQRAGHSTLVVMTATGLPVSSEIKTAVIALLAQAVGNKFFYLSDPQYIDFNVSANVRLISLAPQSAAIAGIEQNLREFYAPRVGNFGRSILRSEIVALIEGTEGVERIVSGANSPILNAPLADVKIAPHQLPRLVNVSLSVV